jgi:hypothetical protein
MHNWLTVTHQDQTSIQHELPGPAPWYWEKYSPISTPSGRRLTWRLADRPEDGQEAGSRGRSSFVVLSEPERRESARLALGTYAQPFLVSTATLGITFPSQGAVTLKSFLLNSLAEFAVKALPFEKSYRETPFIANSTPTSSVEIAASLSAGVHKQVFPNEFQAIREMLLPVAWPTSDPKGPACAIFSMRPSIHEVHVYPQYWFTSEKFDIGYQWITRANRNAVTGRIHGDRVRVDPFRLAEDNCRLDS